MGTRDALTLALCYLTGTAAVALLVGMVQAAGPSPTVKADAFAELDLSTLAPGQSAILVAGDGPPVMVLRRTPPQIAQLQIAAINNPARVRDTAEDPPGLDPVFRSKEPDLFVGYIVPLHRRQCAVRSASSEESYSHIGPWPGGLLEPCHLAAYDTSGRIVTPGFPASALLPIPPHRIESGTQLRVGPLFRASWAKP